jgi:hypothetical protein
MPGGRISATAPSARPCVRLSWSCQYRSTATLPIVAGGRGRQGWGGRNAAAVNAKMIPILLGDAVAMGRRGRQRRATRRTLPPPMLMAATMAAAVAAGRCACCCHCWWWRRHEDNAMVMTMTTATAMATTACTVTAVSMATGATATARAPCRNRCRRLCRRSYLCLHALSFCVSCVFIAPISIMIKLTKCRSLSFINNVLLPS